jgi:hypothetical protein
MDNDLPILDGGVTLCPRAIRIFVLRANFSKSFSTSSWLTELEAMFVRVLFQLVPNKNVTAKNVILPKF